MFFNSKLKDAIKGNVIHEICNWLQQYDHKRNNLLYMTTCPLPTEAHTDAILQQRGLQTRVNYLRNTEDTSCITYFLYFQKFL
jgi:hypothetical protein